MDSPPQGRRARKHVSVRRDLHSRQACVDRRVLADNPRVMEALCSGFASLATPFPYLDILTREQGSIVFAQTCLKRRNNERSFRLAHGPPLNKPRLDIISPMLDPSRNHHLILYSEKQAR